MPLDLESFIYGRPETNDHLGPASNRRRSTIKQLGEIGVNDYLVARSCGVGSDTLRAWKNGTSPTKWHARIALDRLDILLNHMVDDLGLTDDAIKSFLVSEPLRINPSQDPIHDRWHPQVDRMDRTAVIGTICFTYGAWAIKDRLDLRFSERYVEPTEPLAYIH